MLALARRVLVEVDPSQTGKFVPATVTVRTQRGEEHQATATVLPGTPAHPMSEAEHRAKAVACFTSGARPMKPADAERFIDKIGRLESLKSMRDLWDMT